MTAFGFIPRVGPLERKLRAQLAPAKPKLAIVPPLVPVDPNAEWRKHLSRTAIRRRFLIDRARERYELGRDSQRFLPVMRTGGEVIADVAVLYGMTAADLRSPSRNNRVVIPRHEAVFRMAAETNLSLTQMGRLMGDRDHTTMLYAIRAHARRIGAEVLPRGLLPLQKGRAR